MWKRKENIKGGVGGGKMSWVWWLWNCCALWEQGQLILYNLSSYLLCTNDKRTFVWFLKILCWELPHWVSEGRPEGLNIPSTSQTKKKLANCNWAAIIITLYQALLYLLDSTRTAIGQFSGPNSTVRPAKSKTLFLQALFQDKEI